MAMKALAIVTDGDGEVIARFVYADDARFFCREASEREPERSLNLADKAGYYNEYFGPWGKQAGGTGK